MKLFCLLVATTSLHSAATPSAPLSDLTRCYFLISKAESYLIGDRYNAAIDLLLEGKQILTNNPELACEKTSYLYKLLGRAYHKVGNFPDAVLHLENYCKKNPDDPIGIDFLTRSLVANGKGTYSSICRATHMLNVALLGHPDDPDLNYRLGKIHILLARARLEKAAHYSRTALSLKAFTLLGHIKSKP